jgi:ribose transport system substrate-binding protein
MPAQLAYVEKGIVPILLAQPIYLWGSISVEKIIDRIYLNKDVPVINKMELVRVTKDTLPAWAKQLKEWGFTDVPERYLKE